MERGLERRNTRWNIIHNGKLIYNNAYSKDGKMTCRSTSDGKLLVGKYTLDELKNLDKRSCKLCPALVVNGSL
jgi:hypothetical protein